MRARGLFIGIDRYRSPLVPELACAVRDAEALFALFVDTFGAESSIVITDHVATRSEIVEQFRVLAASAAEDDLVFIAYAGHGSDDFYLLPHDADPADFSSTAISLDELVDLFAEIPSRRALLVLDCCFSGGAGARVFRHGFATRGLESVEHALARIVDEGRIIFTACDPSQEAIEDPVEGHGMLTLHLLDGLRGPAEIVQDERIGIYDLLSYVTRRVTEGATLIAHEQRPTFRGKVDGEFKLPVFVPGAEYAKRFPGVVAPPVTSELSDLVPHGIPDIIVDALRAAIPALNQLQIDAINKHGVLAGGSVLVSAPTSSGKTLIGELAALRGAANRRRALFLMPLKALVSDKHADMTRKYGEVGLRILRATGDMHDDVPALLRGQYDICLMTYEKAAALLLSAPHVLRGIGTIVVDEVQMLADKSRGAGLEFLLTLVRHRHRLGMRPQMVLLSAVIGDTHGLERWIGGGLLRSDTRPVPLTEGILRADGTFRRKDHAHALHVEMIAHPEPRKGGAQDILIPVVRTLVERGESVIVFRETKSETRSVASYLARALALPPAASAIRSLPQTDLSLGSTALRDVLAHGVAFHNSDLALEERAVIEDAFRCGDGVRVVVATTALAMGVNTPASTVIIVGLDHPNEEPYSVAEYKNMIGRAGRLGFSSEGKSMVVCVTAMEEHMVWSKYVNGDPEPIGSHFLSADPATLICRVLATADRVKASAMGEAQIIDFIESSFGAFEATQRSKANAFSRSILASTLSRLVRADLVERVEDAHRLTPLGRVAGESGVAVESILRLSEALRGTSAIAINDVTLITATQLTQELDSVSFPVHRSSHQERERWQAALRKQPLPPRLLRELLKDDAATVRAKRSAALLMWVQGKPLLEIETSLMKHLPRDEAAGAVRAVADRTRDLLPVTSRVAELIVDGLQESFGQRVDRLLVQLELGVPSSAAPIAKRIGARLSRGEHLRLHAAGLMDEDSIRAKTDAELEVVLGDTVKVRILREALMDDETSAPTMSSELDTMPDVMHE